MCKFNIPLDLKPHSWKTTDKSVPLFIAVKTITQTLKKMSTGVSLTLSWLALGGGITIGIKPMST